MLDVTSVGVNHDLFLDLGADSFMAMQIAASIRKTLGYPAEIATVQEARTVERLALAIATSLGDSRTEARGSDLVSTSVRSPSIYPLRTGGAQLPLFLVRPASASAGGLAYGTLARHLDSERPIYVFQNRPLLDATEPYSNVQEMAEEYIAAMRAIQPSGPYLLGGWCLGGKTAFEMASRLSSAGDRVDLLVLFDAFPPCDGRRQAEFLEQRSTARQSLQAFARYPWASRLITREKSMMARFRLLAYIDYDNNDINLVGHAFPNRFDLTVLRQMTAEAMWEHVYRRLRDAEPNDIDVDVGSAASARRAARYFAIDHQLDALYTPTQQYGGEVTIFTPRGNRTQAEQWMPFLAVRPNICELDIKGTKEEPDPHNAMMTGENAQLIASELNRLLDGRTMHSDI
ncbi:MAG: hypothetical protein K2Y23_07785 [Cyanobacteria bacterium]|nr:hypothetical protein [Cyanobacteriota bacterium]